MMAWTSRRKIERRQKRLEALHKARAIIEERARERAAKKRPEYERKVHAREARKAAGQRVGRTPKPPQETPAPKDQYNLFAVVEFHPDSRRE